MWSFSPEEILFWPPSITKKSTNPKSKRVKKNGFISILKTSILRFTCKAAGNKHLLDKKKLIKNAIIGRRERKLREKKERIIHTQKHVTSTGKIKGKQHSHSTRRLKFADHTSDY